jgi:hypothetical protein
MILTGLLLALPVVSHAQFNCITNDGTITITRYTGSEEDVTIPDSINGLPVTRIGDNAFSYCTHLVSMTIPDSVTSVGGTAFNGCTNLFRVTIPKTDRLLTSSVGPRLNDFYGCFNLDGILNLDGKLVLINERQFTSKVKKPAMPAIFVSPFNMRFRSIPPGTTNEQVFTVKNLGGGTLSGNVAVKAPFSVVSGSPYHLKAGESTKVILWFRPETNANSLGNVSFNEGKVVCPVRGATLDSQLGVPGGLRLFK